MNVRIQNSRKTETIRFQDRIALLRASTAARKNATDSCQSIENFSKFAFQAEKKN